jgi:TM2 domain-containing membrane protein YozV
MNLDKTSDEVNKNYNKVDMYLMANGRFFKPQHITYIREKLAELSDSQWIMIHTADIKDPNNVMIASVIGGKFGIDRFMIGDVGLGVAKLITCGGLGIWWIVDWFMIQDATRLKNLEKIQIFLK